MPWIRSSSTTSGPLQDIPRQPQLAVSLPQVNHWPRHIRIPMLVRADAVGMRQAKNVRHSTCIDQVGGINSRHHQFSLRPLTRPLTPTPPQSSTRGTPSSRRATTPDWLEKPQPTAVSAIDSSLSRRGGPVNTCRPTDSGRARLYALIEVHPCYAWAVALRHERYRLPLWSIADEHDEPHRPPVLTG